MYKGLYFSLRHLECSVATVTPYLFLGIANSWMNTRYEMITAINKIKERNKTHTRIFPTEGEAKSKLWANNRPVSAYVLFKDLQLCIS